ncbi:MAG: haloacid dehalogenase type II [Elusimicrobia bacterium]|nr:haloacid dehalogenase type II [Elusimicrobiota bacterium]
MTNHLPYDLITFDCYGTLIDWSAGIRSAIEKTGAACGLRLDPAKLADRYIQVEMAVEQGGFKKYREVQALAMKLLFEEQGERLNSKQASILSRSLPRWKPFPETARVLKALRRSGYRLAVLSNVDDLLLKRSISRIGVRFDRLVTSEQVRSYKPRTRHWERILAATRVPKGRVLHVAASLMHDIIPAKTLGLACAWINRNGSKPFAGARPNHVFADLSPLIPLLTPPKPARRSRKR